MAMQCAVSTPSPNLSMVVSAMGARRLSYTILFPPNMRTSVCPRSQRGGSDRVTPASFHWLRRFYLEVKRMDWYCRNSDVHRCTTQWRGVLLHTDIQHQNWQYHKNTTNKCSKSLFSICVYVHECPCTFTWVSLPCAHMCIRGKCLICLSVCHMPESSCEVLPPQNVPAPGPLQTLFSGEFGPWTLFPCE